MKSGKKYKMVPAPQRMYQIIALRDFGDVKKGDLGGRIRRACNLSHEGDCWVYRGAQVSGQAKISGNAKIHCGTMVWGHAIITGDVQAHHSVIYENCRLDGRAKIGPYAIVRGHAIIHGSVHVLPGATVEGNAYIGVVGEDDDGQD